MARHDYSFIDEGRRLEIEAVDSGCRLSEFSVDPSSSGFEPLSSEDEPVLLRSVDDAEELVADAALAGLYVDHARVAYGQRGLIYPFESTGSGLAVVPGMESLAKKAAELSGQVRVGLPVARDFEKRAFNTLWHLIGGWGARVGTSRLTHGLGAMGAVEKVRSSLESWEKGADEVPDYGPNGDGGADGFLILGRTWGGPIVFFQSKNSDYSGEVEAAEFLKVGEVMRGWFGKKVRNLRRVIKVLAINSVLTLNQKEAICEGSGDIGIHLIDAVDILSVEREGRRRKRAFLGHSACDIY